MASKIEWTEETWNPIVGCSKVSAGCKNCYAETMARRLKAMGKSAYQNVVGDNGKWNGEIKRAAYWLDKPLERKKPTMYFVNSMSDMFHNGVTPDMLTAIWDVMRQTPQHTYQILTKRALRMNGIFNAGYLPVLPNVWLGVSVEDQSAASTRIPQLVTTPAAVKFLSCEPLLGPIDLDLQGQNYGRDSHHEYIDWVIVGGESGSKARPCNPDWVRSIRDQCEAAQVPFFFKQWGKWKPISEKPDLVFDPVGKKKAGNLLDGQQWEQYPQ